MLEKLLKLSKSDIPKAIKDLAQSQMTLRKKLQVYPANIYKAYIPRIRWQKVTNQDIRIISIHLYKTPYGKPNCSFTRHTLQQKH